MLKTVNTERGALFICDNCGLLHPSQVVNGQCRDCLEYDQERSNHECSHGHAHCYRH